MASGPAAVAGGRLADGDIDMLPVGGVVPLVGGPATEGAAVTIGDPPGAVGSADGPQAVATSSAMIAMRAALLGIAILTLDSPAAGSRARHRERMRRRGRPRYS
jgi:hypothetical protein